MRKTTLALLLVTCATTPLGSRQTSDPAQTEVTNFGGNAQHTGIFLPPAMELNAIRWSTTVDLRQTFGTTHYGSPLVTAGNTLIVPVKTETDGFQVRAFSAANGKPRYPTLTTDYVLPAHNWIPTYGPALAGRRLYYPGAGGTVFYIANADATRQGPPARIAFYGNDAFDSNRAGFTSTVFINTPLTTDKQGNVFFGFRVQGTAPSPLNTVQSGFARIAPDGNASYVLAGVAAADVTITRDSHNSAPALSNDERTLYVVVKAGTTNNYAYLLGLDASTLTTKYKVFLRDPRNNRVNNASVTDDSTASAMVAPDNDVYFGVQGNPNNGSRGFLLRFSGDLTVEKTPGGFGWDSTAAIVPASMAPLYTGPSPYLIFTKYNNYRFQDGDGVNRIALLDPNVTQVDPHATANGLVQMREVLTIVGPTPDAPTTTFPHAVREWCINTTAVNPATKSIFVPNEDGRLYRWNLATNSLSQGVKLTPGFGEPYVPTIIGPDGTVFTLNGGTLFAVGTSGRLAMTIASSKADTRSAVAGEPLTFTATATGTGASLYRRPRIRGTMTFTDLYYRDSTATAVSSDLARVNVENGAASYTAPALASGTHIITATHDDSGTSVSFVQEVHAFATTTNVAGTAGSVNATVTAVVGLPTGMVTFQEGTNVLAQLPLINGVATFSTSGLSNGAHTITATYASDPIFAASTGSVTIVK